MNTTGNKDMRKKLAIYSNEDKIKETKLDC
jgi:hypothetical protein